MTEAAKVWSPYQQNIFDFVGTGTGNAIVQAVAGSGKSTTIIQATHRIPAGKSCVMLAFNKMIAEALKAEGVNAKTFHSLTYGPVMRHKQTQSVETNKLRYLYKEMLSSDDAFIYGSFISKLVGLARNAGMGVLIKDTEEAWYDLIEHHDLELENDRGDMATGVEHARELLTMSNQSNFVDFDDMLFLAVRDGISLPKFDFIFVDEAQDTNAIQRALIRKIMHAESRVIFVGDKAQAIYGFRGADSNSMALLQEEFQCVELPLTISYRCSRAVVQHALKYVDHIEPAPNAQEGEIINVGHFNAPILETGKLIAGTSTEPTPDNPAGRCFTPRDMVVCRTTKPLVEMAFKLMRQRVPVKILGREIGQGLKALIGKMRANNVDDLITKVEAWAIREVDKAIAKQMDEKVAQLQDKCDAILCLVEGLDEDHRTIDDLLLGIDQLFNTSNEALTLCTIHKSKGLEADRVWWLNSSLCPSKWAKKDWQKLQEKNLCYVATTRAKRQLLLIEDGSGQKNDKRMTRDDIEKITGMAGGIAAKHGISTVDQELSGFGNEAAHDSIAFD